MAFGLPVALVVLAQAASAAPAPATPPPAAANAQPSADCRNAPPSPDSRSILVCGQKPDGYRIDPDILEAKREHRNQSGPRPRDTMTHNDCATVGPMGCRTGPAIDFLAVAGAIAQMAATASKGGDVGKMFETTPEMSEYQLYLEAKKRREAKEAQAAAAAAKAKALRPQTKAQTPAVGPPVPPPPGPR